MNLRVPNLRFLLCSMLACLGTLSHASQAQSANDILERSRAAISEVPGFSAQFRMKGVGGSMFADKFPSMSGQVYFGTHDEFGRVLRILGEYKNTSAGKSEPVDMLIAGDRYIWTDYKTKTVHERPNNSNARGIPPSFPITLIKTIILDDPFAQDTNNADSIEMLEQQTTASVLCDVIEIKRPKKTPGDRSRSRDDSYTDARWHIGTQDRLPRKVEHLTDAGIMKFSFEYELSTLNAKDPTQKQLSVEVSEGFTFKSGMPKPISNEPEANDTTNAPPAVDFRVTDTQADPQPATPRVQRAPAFSFTPAASGSTEINNSTQSDKITVLYFWGSWCIPCKETSPMVSEMALAFAKDPVDVFGIAIREADPNSTKTNFEASDLRHTLVLEADELVSKFKARVLPTIIVIDRDGVIVFQESITKNKTGEALVKNANEAIRSAISGG